MSKIVIITAAGRGMGAAIVRELAANDYRLALMSNSGGAETLAAELGGIAITGSVTNPADLATLVERTMTEYGRIDAVVNNTGHPPKGQLLEISDEDWHLGLDFVMLNVVRMARLVTPIMQAQGGGAIVNISTFATFEPDAGFPVSSSLRAALAGFTKLYADRYAGAGIRMNNVLPGFIDSYPESAANLSPHPRRSLRQRGRGRQHDALPALARCRLHHRPKPPRRRRHHPFRLATHLSGESHDVRAILRCGDDRRQPHGLRHRVSSVETGRQPAHRPGGNGPDLRALVHPFVRRQPAGAVQSEGEHPDFAVLAWKRWRHLAMTWPYDGDRPDVGFRRQGNLFLVEPDSREEAAEGLALQQSLGCAVEWLEPEEIRRRYPILAAPACVGGTFGADDGTMDPWGLLMAFKKKAAALGAEFVHGKVAEICKDSRGVTGVRLDSGERLDTRYVVNAAGAWAPLISETVGVTLPIQPIMRQVFVIETDVRPEQTLPAIFSPSGLYIIHEHGNSFMVGKSLPDDPIGFDFTWDRQRFVDYLWEELAELFPAFDRLKIVRGWAGLYAVNTFDGNAILGEWPELPGLFLENGFSGHGFQQCFAVGRYVAELITGRTPTLDLAIFSPSRILENRPAFESRRRLI